MQVLTNATANSSSAAVKSKVKSMDKAFLGANGTWDTATLTLEYSLDHGVNWIATAVALTADGGGFASVPGGAHLRATLSSVGASTDLNAWINGVETNSIELAVHTRNTQGRIYG